MMLAITQLETEILPLRIKSSVTKVQQKGQVTIPIDFRRYLGIVSGGRVKFSINEAGEITITPVVIAESQSAIGTVERYLKENKITGADLNRIAESVQERLFEEMYGDL